MIIFGGHAAQTERERRGHQIFRPAYFTPAAETFRDVSWHAPYSAIGIRINSTNSGVIRTGRKAIRTIPWDCSIQWVDIIGAPSGSIVFDIYRVPVASFPPTAADTLSPLSIGRPKLESQQVSRNFAMFGWDTALNEGDVLAFDVLSASVITTCTLSMVVSRNNQP